MQHKTKILDTDYKNLNLRLSDYDEKISKARYFLNNYTDNGANQSALITKYMSLLSGISDKLDGEEEMLRDYIENTLETSEIMRSNGLVEIMNRALSDFDRVIDDKKSANQTMNEHRRQIVLSKDKNRGILFFKLLGMILIMISFYIIS